MAASVRAASEVFKNGFEFSCIHGMDGVVENPGLSGPSFEIERVFVGHDNHWNFRPDLADDRDHQQIIERVPVKAEDKGPGPSRDGESGRLNR